MPVRRDLSIIAVVRECCGRIFGNARWISGYCTYVTLQLVVDVKIFEDRVGVWMSGSAVG